MPDVIRVSDLTAEELSALEAQGTDLSKGTVPVPQPKAAPRAIVGDAVLPTSKPLEAPPPPADVVARARERLTAAQSLAGDSSFEERSKTGELLAKQGAVKVPSPPKPEELVEETDKAAFLVSILGGDPFRKVYRLFGGKLLVTFTARSAEVDALCAAQAYRDDEFESLANVEVQARQSLRMNRYFDYQFVASLHTVESVGSPPRVFDVNATTVEVAKHGVGASKIRAARLDLDREFSQPLRVALRSTHTKFENLVAKMTMEANNPDFWEADSAV